MAAQDPTYTPRQLAQHLGVTVMTVRRWLAGLTSGIRLEHGYRTARDFTISQGQVDQFFRDLAEAKRRRKKVVPAEFRSRRPVSRKHREQTAACLRQLGMNVEG